LWYQFQQRPAWRDHYLTLQQRPGQAAFPQITLADVRQREPNTSAAIWPFLPATLDKIAQAVEKKEQVLVLINQLGYARFIQCKACGQKFVCPNCSLNLKYFHQRQELACSYCDFVMAAPSACPTCGNLTFLAQGLGTEKVSLTLQEQLPHINVARFDREELKNFKQISQRLQDFHEGKIDVLVGTQMLAKGHNFKKVNLVCVLGIDHALNFPDFRARERVYQLLTQISGRAGRYGPQSEVIIQTLNRDDQLFTYIKDHSFLGPYEEEIAVRQLAGCPPFGRLVAIYLSGPAASLVEQAALTLAQQAKALSKQGFPQVQVHGPRPGLIEKVANKYRWTILLKSSDPPQLHHLLFKLQDQLSFKKVSIRLDVDPYFLN
jgi:primosomal protein N' (replication factor Y)